MVGLGVSRRVSAVAIVCWLLVAIATPDRALGAGLSEQLAGIDTGPFADTACQASIEALVGAVDGFGGSELKNLSIDDGVISGELTLPIGGAWSLFLFAPDCSQQVFLMLKPGSDLKIGDLVRSVPGIDEIDKLGLVDQVFILSNTDSEVSAEDAPDAVADALSAAAGGDDGVTVAVAPGLTVMGVMDLSRSSLTKNALEFLGIKDSASQRVAIQGLLGEGMLAAMIAGDKVEPDFTLTGTMPNLSLTLPGDIALPEASVTFSIVVSPDGKEFTLAVEVEDEWKPALGIAGLSLSDVTIDIAAGDETTVALSATTRIGGQTLDVAWEAQLADDVEVAVTLSAPDDGGFKIGELAGLGDVPGIDELAFLELTVSPAGFGGRMIWNGEELDAAVAFLGDGSKKHPVVMFKIAGFKLSDIDSAIKNTPLAGVSFPTAILTLATTDPGRVDVDDLPAVVVDLLGEVAEKTDGDLHIGEGVGILAMLDADKLGSAGDALGISDGEFIVGGRLGGIFGGDPEVAIFASLPTFSGHKMPKFLKAVKSVTPRLVLDFRKTSSGVEADIGIELLTELKVGDQTLTLDTAIKMAIATSGVGLNISASLDVWEHAFGLNGFDLSNVAVSIGVDVDGSVSVGIQGDVALKDGRTYFTLRTLMTPDPEALGLPKEVVFDLTTNHVSLAGFLDLADVFIGATGDNAVAKAARGKGLYDTMKLDKLPEIAFVEFKADDGTLQDVRIFLATPGASDPSLDIDGMGMGIVGRLRVAGKDIAQANLSLTESGIAIDGEVLLHKLGPLKIHNAEIDAQASLDELPSFHLNADIELLGIEERIKIVFDREEMGFELDTDLGQVFSSQILANASIADPTNPDFEVRLAFQGDFLDFVLGEIEKELDKALGAYKKDAEAARAALKKAEDDIDAEEKKVQAAFEKAEEDIKKAEADVDKVEDEVKKLQNTINNVKSKIDDKEHDLKNTDFWRVDKQIKLALEIVGLSIELGGVYAAKATAIAALEAVKGSMELVPVLFQPALLASNAVFEAAKGAVTVADLTVQASEYALKGIEDAIAEYRKSFHFEEAIFDGSLQALLGNKPIVMETKFVAFGKNVDLDLTFTPASPEDLGKAVGTLMKKLGKEIVKDIEHAFFGGGSSGGSGSSSGGGSFTPPDWSGQGAIDQSIPLKGAKYINQKSKKCLVLSKGNLAFGDCKGVHDSQLFRFSPDGDLVAVGSDAASPLCVTARGPKAGAAVEATACADSALQKWRFANGQLSTASGFCAMPHNGGLQLVGCDEKASAQLWTSEAIADLKALSDQPQDTLFSVSFRTPDGKTCIDGADGLILEYQCDGEDYQVFDLRSDGQLRSGFDCVLAKHKKKGGTLYLGKCEDADVKWVWNKSHMKVKGSKLCMMRNPPNRLKLMPVTLGACADAESQWTLEPTNVDPKGRILPAFAMIRTPEGRCVEVRSDLQVDGLTRPGVLLWSCNGDFNQGFSFRWNGEIRSLGHCLTVSANKPGTRIKVDDCVGRPSALDPAKFFKVAGTQRNEIDHQHWKLRDDGTIRKTGTKLCLATDPNGRSQKRFDPLAYADGVVPPPGTAARGSVGTLLTLEKCSGGAGQKWIVSNKLPGGSLFAGYVQLGHKIKGIERCLETSGQDEFRKIVSRSCRSDSNYQSFALTPSGEIRQMGRCLTTIKKDKSFGDGYMVELDECADTANQKFATQKDGRLTQKLAADPGVALSGVMASLGANARYASAIKKTTAPTDAGAVKTTTMCVTEGPPFDPTMSMPFLTKAQKDMMKKLSSFAFVGVESCTVALKNSKRGTCMRVGGDGTVVEANCGVADAFKNRQAFAISGGNLMQRSADDKGFHIRKVWIDAAVDQSTASTQATPDLKAAGNNVLKAIQTMVKTYAEAGWAWDAAKSRFRYGNGKCLAAPTGKGRLSSSAKKKLADRIKAIVVRKQQLMPKRAISSEARVELESLQKKTVTIKRKLAADKASYHLRVASCTTGSDQKWQALPVGATMWKVK